MTNCNFGTNCLAFYMTSKPRRLSLKLVGGGFTDPVGPTVILWLTQSRVVTPDDPVNVFSGLAALRDATGVAVWRLPVRGVGLTSDRSTGGRSLVVGVREGDGTRALFRICGFRLCSGSSLRSAPVWRVLAVGECGARVGSWWWWGVSGAPGGLWGVIVGVQVWAADRALPTLGPAPWVPQKHVGGIVCQFRHVLQRLAVLHVNTTPRIPQRGPARFTNYNWKVKLH